MISLFETVACRSGLSGLDYILELPLYTAITWLSAPLTDSDRGTSARQVLFDARSVEHALRFQAIRRLLPATIQRSGDLSCASLDSSFSSSRFLGTVNFDSSEVLFSLIDSFFRYFNVVAVDIAPAETS